MSIRSISASLLLGTCLVLGGCGSNNTASGVQPSAAASQPTAAPALPAITDTALDQPLLEAPTSMPTSAPTEPAAPTVEVATPTPVPHYVQRIEIPTIDLDRETFPVGLDNQGVPIVPKHDVGWYQYSAAPGQGENVVLWAHVLRFRDSPDIPAPFRRVRELKPGAKIVVYDDTNTPYTYMVTEQVWVEPTEVKYILPTGSEQLTLVSCIGDKVKSEAGVEMTHRLITIAKPAS